MATSAYVDTFARDNLPPPSALPEFIFERPELQLPERLNVAAELLDEPGVGAAQAPPEALPEARAGGGIGFRFAVHEPGKSALTSWAAASSRLRRACATTAGWRCTSTR